MKQMLVLYQSDVIGASSVMPAKAGIQEDRTEALNVCAGIPACAGMTPPRLTLQIPSGGFFGSLPLLMLALVLAWSSVSPVFAQVGGLTKQEADMVKAQATMRAAEELYDHGEADEAIKQWREAIQLDPTIGRAHHDLGLALRDKGQLAEAISELREAARLSPTDASAQADLGDALREKGDIDGALSVYRTAISILPDSAPLHSNLGYLLIRKGDLDGAIAEWREATRIDPKYAPPYANLGEALESKGDKAGARKAYEKFLELVPGAPQAGEVAKRLTALKDAEGK
jgi:Flp pilus assembly protein TadD